MCEGCWALTYQTLSYPSNSTLVNVVPLQGFDFVTVGNRTSPLLRLTGTLAQMQGNTTMMTPHGAEC